jgi:hypothetical protein
MGDQREALFTERLRPRLRGFKRFPNDQTFKAGYEKERDPETLRTQIRAGERGSGATTNEFRHHPPTRSKRQARTVAAFERGDQLRPLGIARADTGDLPPPGPTRSIGFA